ncbi:MAG: LapA family protein [Desulfatiglandales bacterium]
MKHLKFIFIVLIVFIVVVLAYQNGDALLKTVQFRMDPGFYNEIRSPEIAVGLALLMAFFLGVIVVGFCGIMERYRLNRQIKGYAKELELKNKELNSLRNLPITSDDVKIDQLNGV